MPEKMWTPALPVEEINHPDHYGGDTTYEVIKVLEAWEIHDPYIWNAIKYMARAGKKPGSSKLKDLQKAQFYLNRRVSVIEANLESRDGVQE